jgi:phospholipase A-2-activating protein
MQVDWELSQQFISDSQGIRAACLLLPSNKNNDNDNNDKNDGAADAFSIVTGNQGGGLCAFGVPSGSLTPIEYQHDDSVMALLSNDQNGYVTGCKDAMIRIFDASHKLQATLKGHEKPVTSLAFASTSEGNRYLVSGSWDGTAKVWDITRGAMVATLPDHENSVCVVGFDASKNNGSSSSSSSSSTTLLRIATGSAGMAQNNQISGHTVRQWTVDIQTGQVKCTHSVANDHEGPIRNVTLLPNNNGLATCSNDGTVKLRSNDTGDCLSTLVFMQQQHPPMLLSVTPITENDEGSSASLIAASAEDGHVVVWNLVEGGDPQILLHPSCVWNVIALPNGDLATCCQDGTLRIFTRASDRMAPSAERELFVQTVQEAHQKQSSGPTPEEVAKLPLWETNLLQRGTSEGQVQLFNKAGVAIAAQWSMTSQTWIEVGQVMGSSDGGAIDGVRYDHILPVEVDQEGGVVAKLQIGYNNGENPFVAAQRFLDAHNIPQYQLQDIADYILQRVGKDTPTLGGGGGSSGAPVPVATTGIPMVSYQHLPTTGYKSFELPSKTGATTLEKMKNKIQEYGKLSDAQLALISTLTETLLATSRYHATKVTAAELAVIADMLEVFTPNEAFPALDLARLTVLHPDAASASNSAFWQKLISKALSLCEIEGLEGPAAVAIPMLSLRLFANAFRGGPGSLEAAAAAALHLEELLKCANKFIPSKNKNVRLSVATLLYNISYYLHSNPPARPEIACQVVAAVDSILKCNTYEGEAVTRALVALGTVVMASPEAKEAAKALHVVSRVEMAASPHGDVAKTVAKEVYNVMAG